MIEVIDASGNHLRYTDNLVHIEGSAEQYIIKTTDFEFKNDTQESILVVKHDTNITTD